MPLGTGLPLADELRQIISTNCAEGMAAIPSICSARPDGLLASLLLAAELHHPIVMVATSNLVNQDAGYSDQQSADFVSLLRRMAEKVSCPPDYVTYRGNHLDPEAWRHGDAGAVVVKARVLVEKRLQACFATIDVE